MMMMKEPIRLARLDHGEYLRSAHLTVTLSTTGLSITIFFYKMRVLIGMGGFVIEVQTPISFAEIHE